MKIIEKISFSGYRNVVDRVILIPNEVDNLIITGLDSVEKVSILHALATNNSNSVSIVSKVNSYQVIIWDGSDVPAMMEKLISLKSIPVLLLIEEAEIGLNTESQKSFLTKLIRLFPNMQILASTSSPFILLELENCAAYNLDTGRLYTDLYKKKFNDFNQIVFGI